ncbi:MAG: Mu transposase C-terminal domain-containing protein, partial [Bacteroidota bacterium]
PSYRACMMVLRICVQRFQRFPQSLVVDNGAEFHSNYFEQLLASFACTKKNRPPAHARFGSVVERLFGTANTEFIYELRGNTQLSRLHRQVTKSVKPENQAIWTISDLYEALCKWAYEVYDRCDHPALGQSPRTTFNQGLILGGKRLHRRVAYDESFRILTLPAPEREKRKVQPGRGIKINGVYYWSNEFRNPEIEKTLVDVRYEPFDVGIAYAFVNGQWAQCIADDYQHLQGRSEKEIKLISAELRKRRRSSGKTKSATTRELVQFLNSVEAKEGELLKQRLKASENKAVSDLITGKMAQPSFQSQSQPNQPPKLRLLKPEGSSPSELEQKDQQPPSLECYGEF